MDRTRRLEGEVARHLFEVRVRLATEDGRLRLERRELGVQPVESVRFDDFGRESVSGRPWRPGAAWALLAMLAGSDVELSPVDRLRIGRRAEAGAVANLARLRVRAEERRFYGHPSVLGPLVESPGVIRSGVSAVGDHEVDLVESGVAEGYVRATDVEALVERFALEEDAARWNVLLRVVDDEVCPFELEQRVAPAVVVAVDLLDASDERSRRAGAVLLDRR